MLAVLGGLVHPRLELVHLVGLVGERQRARLLEVAVDVVLADERDQAGEVVAALPLEALELVREMADAVGEPVGQACLAEPAVAPRRTERHGLRLQHDHAQGRVRIGQGDRGPQAREPSPDDDDIRGQPGPGRERRIRGPGRIGLAQPVADRAGRGRGPRVGRAHDDHRATFDGWPVSDAAWPRFPTRRDGLRAGFARRLTSTDECRIDGPFGAMARWQPTRPASCNAVPWCAPR